ncbi:F0F1 ATP synthase subunit gamma [Pedomonas mirosovicensis]|uniref:F0F1 ATP synthase subunit gamma n=1 Tax=Pedomonas mirosovicensis TaxID=2908641 RepID=UPI0021680738|nr:F0F1 ATP synthase subunit gamma [Pedomonas mirosovicensis]MCH8684576.1 F0F1 ATP synthase subunit gamma [Pedomonas mirosovicensis]
MPSLKSLKNRIASVKSTQKITKAMKMVAAAKLRRAQEAAEAARPYAERMEAVLASLATKADRGESASKLLVGTGRDDVHLVVVATSERGLCGAFNTNIVRGARLKIDALLRAGKQVKILCVGKKGRAALRRFYGDMIIDTIDMSHVRRLGFADAQPIAERVIDMFNAGEFDVAWLFYAKFKSALVQFVTEQQLIPARLPEAGEAAAAESVVEYEPSEEQILETLLPRNIAVQIFRALLENAASEQGSRMTAMDNATRNAGDMINRLTLQYNRSRQAAITTELTEIISGAEAL